MELTVLKIAAIFCLGVGLIAWKISSDVRYQADQKLKNEITATGAVNNQILSAIEGYKKYEEERERAQRDREFCRSIGEKFDCMDESREKREAKEKDRKLCLALGKESNCLE